MIEADPSPIDAPSQSFRDLRVLGIDDGRFAIGPSLGAWFFGWFFAAIGGLVLTASGLKVSSDPSAWLAVGVGGLFIVLGLAMLIDNRRFVFDLEARQLRVRSVLFGTIRARPLSEIHAVQVIEGGYHEGTGEDAISYDSYQLNLVLGEGRGGRINLSNHADRAWTVATGARLAAFLGVPCLGALAEAPTTSADDPVGVYETRSGGVEVLASDERLLRASASARSMRGMSCLTMSTISFGLAIATFEFFSIWDRGVPVVIDDRPLGTLLGLLVLVGFTAVWLGVLRFILGGFLGFSKVLMGREPARGWRLELGPFEWVAIRFEASSRTMVRLATRDVLGVDLDLDGRLVARTPDGPKALTPTLEPSAASWLRQRLSLTDRREPSLLNSSALRSRPRVDSGNDR